MIVRMRGSIVMVGLFVPMASPVWTQSMDCSQNVTLSQFVGGKLSAEELAKKLNTDAETVRRCLDKKAQKTKGGGQTSTPRPRNSGPSR